MIPLSTEASQYYGRNTKWCTAATKSECYFDSYFYDNNIVLIYVSTPETKVAIVTNRNLKTVTEIYDDTDTLISESEFTKIVNGIKPQHFVELASKRKSEIMRYAHPLMNALYNFSNGTNNK